MCVPKTVHKHSCGHYVLDLASNGCAHSTRSTHCPPDHNQDVRSPCEALLYELLACGERGEECLFEGRRIRIQIYFSAVFCYALDQKWKKQDEEKAQQNALYPGAGAGASSNGQSGSEGTQDTLAKPTTEAKKKSFWAKIGCFS